MDDEREIIQKYRVVAMVGLSDSPERPSYRVASYLLQYGFRVIPVNPNVKWVFGQTCYPDLLSVPEPIEVVDIFRRSEDVTDIVDQAIRKGAKAVWMQEGVVNEEAAAVARAAGLLVVMDKCIKKEHAHFSTPPLHPFSPK